jgi:outer membrane protein TolC
VLTLPFFNRNRGKIAVEKATRQQLRQEYQARIAQAYGQADLIWTRQRLLIKQLHQLQRYLPTLEKMVEKARRAYADQNIAPITYINMENTLANKRLKAIHLMQGLWETAIALDALLARHGITVTH